MDLIATEKLREFCRHRPIARAAVERWETMMRQLTPANYNELRATYPSADYAVPFTIFNIGGNRYRIVAIIDYAIGRVLVRAVMTHPEYDKWSRQYRQGKVK